MSSIRQKKVAGLLQREIGGILQQNGSNYYGFKALVTLSHVEVTPDLLVAKVYVSIYNVEDKESVLTLLKQATPDIRGKVGKILRHHLRRIPELLFFLDDSLDTVYKLEQLFDDLKQ